MPQRRIADEVRVLSVRLPLEVFEKLTARAGERGQALGAMVRDELVRLVEVASIVDWAEQRVTLSDALDGPLAELARVEDEKDRQVAEVAEKVLGGKCICEKPDPTPYGVCRTCKGKR